jgi:hypothetical protein
MKELDKLYNPALIFSVCQGIDPDNDVKAIIETENKLKDLKIPYKLVNGCVNGGREVSFYCEHRDIADYLDILDIAREFNQESVLELDKRRNAELLFLKNNIPGQQLKQLGVFKQVPENIAKDSGDYTHDPENDGYYICE